jgi:crotonobetainyl-CoA:carnitine CoA-transferase CaiB-like acyl-CoA transferase
VLDIATIIAGPSAATLLADYGADVVKLELPGGATGRAASRRTRTARRCGGRSPTAASASPRWTCASPRARPLLLRLLPRFDVLVENFRPGTLDRWGLTSVTRCGPRSRGLVILRVTGFGQTGPYRTGPALRGCSRPWAA